jgi:predicted nuclease of predicted toxin-antitoxin system
MASASTDTKPNTAILWDIENVTPPSGSGYIQSIIDTINEKGRISYAMAFGDWNRNHIKNIAGELASISFELIHVPAARKDSSDMSMVAHGVELIFQYAHIDYYVLITGDADFRPLLLSLRKYGKKTLIICDVKNNASEDLLNMADEFLDYREIIDDGNDPNEEESAPAEVISRPQAYQLLEEAVEIMLNEKKKPAIGAVKIKMKLLNSDFDERKLGYRAWKAFVNDAVTKTAVRYMDDEDKYLTLDTAARNRKRLPDVFSMLVDSLPTDKETWAKFDETSKILARKIDLKKSGYSQFKKLALDAEKRGLVAIKNKLFTWYIKRN